jgi:potassium-transporting ATPase KdpC subunit
MLKQLIPGLRITLVLTILTGVLYPGAVTGLCQLFFRQQANGSLIVNNGRILGSSLIGQSFTAPEYFHSRPSSAGVDGYDASASAGSNLGPTSKKLVDRVKGDVEKFRKENPDYQGPIPSDIATASGSGLDPHISPAAAQAQALRVAKARGVSVDQVNPLIAQYTEAPVWGFLGDARVNVLQLNLALDQHFREYKAKVDAASPRVPYLLQTASRTRRDAASTLTPYFRSR